MKTIPRNVKVTRHAVDQFMLRLREVHPECKDPQGLFEKALRTATLRPINLTSYLGRQKRHGKNTEYYCTVDGWRFVIEVDDEGEMTLVTTERVSKLQSRCNTYKGDES